VLAQFFRREENLGQRDGRVPVGGQEHPPEILVALHIHGAEQARPAAVERDLVPLAELFGDHLVVAGLLHSLLRRRLLAPHAGRRQVDVRRVPGILQDLLGPGEDPLSLQLAADGVGDLGVGLHLRGLRGIRIVGIGRHSLGELPLAVLLVVLLRFFRRHGLGDRSDVRELQGDVLELDAIGQAIAKAEGVGLADRAGEIGLVTCRIARPQSVPAVSPPCWRSKRL